MGKHFWHFFNGCVIVLPLVIFYKFLRFTVEYGDKIGNDILFYPLLSRNIPVAGFLISVIFIYGVGLIKTTKWGTRIHNKIMGSVPLLGKVFTAPTAASQTLLRYTNGFIYAPIQNGYRPARFTAAFRTKNGSWWTILFFPMLPTGTTQAYPDSTIIYALKNGETYSVFSTEIGLRAEFTAGTTVSEKSFQDLVPVTIKEFWETQRFADNFKKGKESQVTDKVSQDFDRGMVPMKCDKREEGCNYGLPHYHCKICGHKVNSDELRRDYHPCCSAECIRIWNQQYPPFTN